MVASSIWASVLQAAGHVKSLAKAQALSALGGLCFGLPLIYFFGTIGIAVSLLLAAAVPMAFTWHVARRDCVMREAPARAEDVRALFDMGVGLMAIGIASQLAAYCVRLLIIKQHGDDVAAGLADAGYYQAAIAIAGSLPALVFSAMARDFCPRVAAAKDETEAKALAEKQIEAARVQAPPNNVLVSQIMERLILESLQLQEADRRGVQVDDETLTRAVLSFAEQAWQQPVKGLFVLAVPAEQPTPFVQALTARGYEVAFFTDVLDEYVMQHLQDYEDHRFVNVSKEDVTLGEDDEAAAAERDGDLERTAALRYGAIPDLERRLAAATDAIATLRASGEALLVVPVFRRGLFAVTADGAGVRLRWGGCHGGGPVRPTGWPTCPSCRR
jgi:hypothetical protein